MVHKRMYRRRLLLTVGAVLATASAAFAQNAPTIISATRYIVKPERSADMAGAIKEFNEVLKKAHSEQARSVWRSNSGPVAIYLVTFSDKFAELDTPGGLDPKLKEYS